MSGTALIGFKQAATAALGARLGLSGVSVSYGFPDVEAIPTEAIWFEGAESDTWDPVMKAGIRRLDESSLVDLVIQVTLTQGETQEASDIRALALFVEVQNYFAENPDVGGSVMWALLDSWVYAGGRLESGGGHGARFTLKVRFRARHN